MRLRQSEVIMKIIYFHTALALFAIGGLSAPLALAAQITFSGILDSTVSMNAGAGKEPGTRDFSGGMEEFANLRFQSKLRDSAVIYGAVNLIAAAGDYAANAARLSAYNAVRLAANAEDDAPPAVSPSAYVYGENYIAAIELERLYFRLNGEYIAFDAGLFRLPFGYGQIWGPSDFLNPKNPLKPDARPRAVLGAGFFWYPNENLKLLGFGAASREPLSLGGEGAITGISLDQHWDSASVQVLYSYETPKELSSFGIHRAGFSLKFDMEAGFVLDALYTYNHEEKTEVEGLSFSTGFDYSFFDGNLIVLVEYLYNGYASSTALEYGGSFINNYYLYAGFTLRFTDLTSATAALIYGFEDVSFTPVISLNHELFQGAALTITAQVPLDRDLFYDDGRTGEFGPRSYNFNGTVRLRLRF